MFKFNFKPLLPYAIAVIVFAGITLAYFNPLLEGKRMKQADITHHLGMSKEIADYRAKTGKEALWTNSMFGGMPAYQISVKYKGNLVQFFDRIFMLGLPHPAGLVFLYMIGFFLLLIVLNISPWISIAGSIAYGFSSYFFIILLAGHNSKAHAIGYMAPVLASLILTYHGKYLLGGILSALFLTLEVSANHPQITYYLVLMVLVFLLSEFIYEFKNKRLPVFFKATAVVAIGAVLAVGSNLPSLWATWEYGKETIRGKSELTTEKENRTSGLDKDYATGWSYGIGETFTLLIPDVRGGASGGSLGESSNTYKALVSQGIDRIQAGKIIQSLPLYWGTQPNTAGPTYAGAIIIFLFVLGLLIVDNRYRWWLLAATVFSVLLAWGKNFMPLTNFFLEYFPGYNKFRAVSMTLVIAEFTIPMLAILALHKAFSSDGNRKHLLKNVFIAAGITGGITLVFALLGSVFFKFTTPNDAEYASIFPDWMMQAIREDRAAMLRRDAFRSFVFIALGCGVIWAALNSKLKRGYAFAILIILILGDMWAVNRRYVNNDLFTSKRAVAVPYSPTEADLLIMKDIDPNFRVFNQTVSPFNDASTSYFHKSIGGYHGAKLRRYQEVIEHCLAKGNMNVYNMLNTKYFIVPDKDRNNAPTVQVNMQALGHAWFVNDVKWANNADEELSALDSFNPTETAIVDKRFLGNLKGIDISKDSTAHISLQDYEPNRLKYKTSSAKQQLAVFSEIYYKKGWNAYVDGKPAPHFRANYILRAMVVPEGNHEVEFRFEPTLIASGQSIAYASSSLILLVMLIAAGFGVKNMAQQQGKKE